MALTENQIKLLKGIKRKLMRGDINRIAALTEKDQAYVSRVLSPKTDNYYDPVVNEAVKIISEREQNTKNLLDQVA